MKEFPSNKSIIISIIALLIYFNISFFKGVDKNFALQRYQWDKQEVLDSISNIKIISTTRKELKIAFSKKFSMPTKYTYALKNNHKMYYFRYEYMLSGKDFVSFQDVHWLKGMPHDLQQHFTFVRLKLPLIQHGKHTAMTIGDENFCRHHDEDFRKELASAKSLKFVGNQKDVLGFPMSAAVNWSSQNILNIVKQTVPADYYFLMFNWHENKESLNVFLQNLPVINAALLKKNPKKIFWIIPPVTKDTKVNNSIIKIITKLKTNKVVIINPYLNDDFTQLQDSNRLYNKQTIKSIAQLTALQL